MASEEVSNDEVDTIVSESEDVETPLKEKETPKGLQNGSSSKVSNFQAVTNTLILDAKMWLLSRGWGDCQ